MTEADARALLRDCGGFGSLEGWTIGICTKSYKNELPRDHADLAVRSVPTHRGPRTHM
jgi:hypothetical protein